MSGYKYRPEFEIIESLGVLDIRKNGWRTEVNLISWDKGPPVIDIRDWLFDHSRKSKGVNFTEAQAAALAVILSRKYSS